MAKDIKGLLFDKDGTLFDFQKSWGVWCGKVVNEIAADEPQKANQLAQVLMFDRETLLFSPESPVIAGTLDELVDLVRVVFPDRDRDEVRTLMISSASDAPMAPAVELAPLLHRLKAAGLKIGLATNDAEAAAQRHLEVAKITSYFDFIAGYDSGYGGKPEPGMLLGFCAEQNLDPGDVAMVGDSTHDLFAGKAAGMVTVGVLTGTASRADLTPHADIVLDDIGDIPAWLELG